MEIKSFEIVNENKQPPYYIRINDSFNITIDFDFDISNEDAVALINMMFASSVSNDNLLRAFYFTFGVMMEKAGLLPVNSDQGDNNEQD